MKNSIVLITIGLIAILMCISCSKPTNPEILTVANPEIQPGSGSFSIPQLITISCATSGAAIYYSINGDNPDQESLLYTEPFTLFASGTVKTIAFKDGYTPSAVVSTVYTINLETVSTPSFNLPEGSYNGVQSVSILCETEGATLRYTTDGSAPNENSTIYTAPLMVSETTILGARAYKADCLPSQAFYALYSIDLTPLLEMLLIPAGSVTMGDTRGEGYNNDQYPTHTIHLNSFYLGKYELLQSQYQAVIGSIPDSNYGEGTYFPVYGLSWYAAIKFCNILSIRDGYTPVYSISGTTNPNVWGNVPLISNPDWNAAICNWGASGYRLPSEAEWEYAARGATMNPDYIYSGSHNYSTVAWCMTTPVNSAHEVGQKAPNGLGFYDMSGNVYEWCWDWYGNYPSSPQYDPHGPLSGSYRIIRSGAWDSLFFRCSVFYRSNSNPYFVPQGLGLRLCRTANGS